VRSFSVPPDSVIDDVLNEREFESLRFGYRERDGCESHHIRELPQVLPHLCRCGEPRREAGFDG